MKSVKKTIDRITCKACGYKRRQFQRCFKCGSWPGALAKLISHGINPAEVYDTVKDQENFTGISTEMANGVILIYATRHNNPD